MQYSQLLVLGVALAAMWFLLIRPQQQRQKQHQQTVSSLVPGQHIVTIGGLVGEIIEVRGDRLLLKVADGSELEYIKEAVGRVLPADEVVEWAELANETDDAQDDEADTAVGNADEGEDAQ